MGAAERLRPYFRAPGADAEIDQRGLNRPRRALRAGELPVPLTERCPTDIGTAQRVIHEQLATRRRHTRAEAAQALNIKDTWLKRWVTARCIPHQRSGEPNGKQQRGVWFTWADILAIAEMLPELMSSRQSKRVATPGGPSVEELDRWTHLGF